jgi:hypothetical protein
MLSIRNSYIPVGTVVGVIAWQLDLQLHMQSMPIITDVLNSNLDQGEVYNIMWKSFSVTCDRKVVSSTNKADGHDIAEI